MLERTPENFKVSIFRLTDDDPDKINFNDVIKAFYMAADIRLVCTEDVWADGEVPIFDMTNITIRHFTRVVFSTMRLFMKYSQEAHPVIVQQIHIVNCSSLLNRVLAIMRPFLKAEVAERIQTHLPNSDTLFKFIPRELLPKEYNGFAGSIEDIREHWLGYLDSYRWGISLRKILDANANTWSYLICRDYLNNEENWRLND